MRGCELEVSHHGFADSLPKFRYFMGLRHSCSVLSGDPFFVDCAEKDFHHTDECRDLRVCVYAKTDDKDIVGRYLPERQIVVYDVEDLLGGILGRDCNVIAMTGFCPVEQILSEYSKVQDIKVGTRFYSQMPISAVTRSDDPVFSDFVNSIIHALMAAEEYGITQEYASDFPQTDLFGLEYQDMYRNAIRYQGNFDELFRKTMPQFWPRYGLNQINDGSTGLLYALISFWRNSK